MDSPSPAGAGRSSAPYPGQGGRGGGQGRGRRGRNSRRSSSNSGKGYDKGGNGNDAASTPEKSDGVRNVREGRRHFSARGGGAAGRGNGGGKGSDDAVAKPVDEITPKVRIEDKISRMSDQVSCANGPKSSLVLNDY